jgi:hypothetical protein
MASDLAKLREQLRNGNEDEPSPGLLTVTSTRSSRSSAGTVQKTQPYSISTKATQPPVNPEKKPGPSRQRLYAIAALALVAFASLVAFGRHRLKPVVLTEKSTAAPFRSAPKAAASTTPSKPTAPRPQATDERDSVLIANTKKSAPAPQSDANLRVDVEHPFSTGKISLWVDGKLKYTEALHGEAKKKLIVFRKTEGHTFEKIQIPSGKHSIRVRVQSPEQYYDLASAIVANLPDNGTQTLTVRCEKEQVKLAVE